MRKFRHKVPKIPDLMGNLPMFLILIILYEKGEGGLKLTAQKSGGSQVLTLLSSRMQMEYNTMPIPVEKHSHDFLELVFVVRGPLVHHHPYGVDQVETGDVFLINLEEIHWYEFSPNVAFYNFMIKPAMFYEIMQVLNNTGGFDTQAMLDSFVLHQTGIPVLHLEAHDFEFMRTMSKELLSESNHENVGASVIEQALLSSIMVLLFRQWERTFGEVRSAYSPRGKMVMQAVNYIQQNYSGHISIDELSARFYVSPDYFRKAFKQIIGISPLKYINSLRIHYATALMYNPSLSIADIAQQTGFNDLNNFTRIFTSIHGMAPSVYRKRHAQAQKQDERQGGL